MKAAPSSSSLSPATSIPTSTTTPGEADQQAHEPAPGRPLRAVEAQRQHRHQQRHRRDDDRRQRGVHVLLARRDQRERDRDLQERVGGQPPPAALQRPERPGAVREHEQHHRGEHDPRPRHERRREPVVDRDLDEQVRDPPQHRHRREPRPRPCRHPAILAASGSRSGAGRSRGSVACAAPAGPTAGMYGGGFGRISARARPEWSRFAGYRPVNRLQLAGWSEFAGYRGVKSLHPRPGNPSPSLPSRR